MHSAWLFDNFLCSSILRFLYAFEDDRLAVNVFGIDFKNPIGLAAGFDKNCQAYHVLSDLGFGFIEAGTVTASPQPGNPKPRIFRFPYDNALINRMGFPSEGADVVARRLQGLKRNQNLPVLGINIGKSKVAHIDFANEDYLSSFNRLKNFGDFFVLNVSSPNTPELRKLQEKARLSSLFRSIQSANSGKKPLMVKIAPDLNNDEIDAILECCFDAGVAGIIATNTTFSRDNMTVRTEEIGGLSGAPLKKRSLEVVSHIYRASGGKIPIIAVGGISSATDVINSMKAGASLVQIYTALIYEGPSIVKKIKKDLLQFMDQNAITHINDIKP